MEIENEIKEKYINPIMKEDENHKKYVLEKDLEKLNLSHNERVFIDNILRKLNITIKKELIKVEDRSPLVRDYNYGNIETNDLHSIDEPKLAEIEHEDNILVFENYEKLDEFIENDFIPENIQMKINKSKEKGVRYPSIQLNKIIALKLSELEVKHVIEYLQNLGIRIGGKSSDLDSEFENYDYVSTYKNTILPQELDSNEQIDLFIKYKKVEDSYLKSKIREQLIQSNLRLVPWISYRIALSYNIEQEVLESYGYEGLIYSVENFNPYYGYKFSTYATKTIKGYIKKYIPKLNELPAYLYFDFHRYQQVVEKEFERPFNPNDTEMLEDILDLMLTTNKITESQRKIIKDRLSINTESLDALSEKGDLILDVETSLDDTVNLEMLREDISQSLDTLTVREAIVLKARFGLEDGIPKRLDEVGDMIGVSRERVRQIEARALRKLRHPSRSKKLKDYINTDLNLDNNIYADYIINNNDNLENNGKKI